MSIITGHVHKTDGRDAGLGLPIQWTIWNPIGPDAGGYDVDRIVTAAAPNTTAGGTLTATLAAQPDVPRCLWYDVSTDTDGDCVLRFDVRGTDFWGNDVSETVTNVTTTGLNGSTVFRTVSQIVVTTQSASDIDPADRFVVGVGPRLGLPVRIKAQSDVLAVRVGEIEGGSGAAVDAMASLTLEDVLADLGAGEFYAQIGTVSNDTGNWFVPHNTAGQIPSGASGTVDYSIEVMSTYGIQYQ